MFKVKATVIGYKGDNEKYPCHFRYKIGDEIVHDGEKISGRVCLSILPDLGKAFKALMASGGRHKEGEFPASYFPFWHASLSVYDPSYKKFDGVGFRPTLERPEENYKFVADKSLYNPPPGGKYIIGKGTEKRTLSVVCEDQKTLVVFNVEAFDLADKGDSLPYFRREMSVLNIVQEKSGIAMDEILGKFSRDEILNIYPPLGQHMITVLVGELELTGYVKVKDNKVSITDKGTGKLAEYKHSLTAEEKKALKL
jgi:uncharacterized repeat protein (TIGR04076 family)